MTIVPDTKDWTWVLTRRCPDCGFDAAALARPDVGSSLRRAAAELTAALDAPEAATRPAPGVWSALEYGCHVRDTFRVFLGRLELILAENDPLFANWDQDETAVVERYAEQDPAQVRRELTDAADVLAGRFESLPADVWQRPGRRSDGAVFTLTTFSQYLVHDPVHHVWDVTHA
ncbi:MAG: methyltransferase type 12 [Frankiales bacterium]|nr:methyltransferase type 12 [Frankiales bacterium]